MKKNKIFTMAAAGLFMLSMGSMAAVSTAKYKDSKIVHALLGADKDHDDVNSWTGFEVEVMEKGGSVKFDDNLSAVYRTHWSSVTLTAIPDNGYLFTGWEVQQANLEAKIVGPAVKYSLKGNKSWINVQLQNLGDPTLTLGFENSSKFNEKPSTYYKIKANFASTSKMNVAGSGNTARIKGSFETEESSLTGADVDVSFGGLGYVYFDYSNNLKPRTQWKDKMTFTAVPEKGYRFYQWYVKKNQYIYEDGQWKDINIIVSQPVTSTIELPFDTSDAVKDPKHPPTHYSIYASFKPENSQQWPVVSIPVNNVIPAVNTSGEAPINSSAEEGLIETNGKVHGGVVLNGDSAFSTAARFNGSGYVELDTKNAGLNHLYDKLSISLWYKINEFDIMDGNDSWHTLFHWAQSTEGEWDNSSIKHAPKDVRDLYVAIAPDSMAKRDINKGLLYVRCGDIRETIRLANWDVKNRKVMYDDNWHNLTITVDGTSQTFALYLDGAFIRSNRIYPTGLDFSSNILLGASWNNEDPSKTNEPSEFLMGKLAKVNIYDRVLSQTEIQEIAQEIKG